MSTARKPSAMNQGPIPQKIHHTIDKLEQFLMSLSKDKDTPNLQQGVDECAKSLLSVIEKHHNEIAKYESYLKNAIIDLTEVPYMQPQMQRIAFEVSIRAAVKNLNSFLNTIS